MIGSAGIVEAWQGSADRVDTSRSGRHRDRHARIRRSDVGIAADVLVGEHKMPGGVTVVATEPVAPVVAVPSILALACLRIEQPFVGADAKIAPADIDFGAGLDRAAVSAA